MGAWTAGELAELDQDLAVQDRKMTELIEAYLKQVAEHGETQALANVTLAFLITPFPEHVALLLVALRRLTRPESAGDLARKLDVQLRAMTGGRACSLADEDADVLVRLSQVIDQALAERRQA